MTYLRLNGVKAREHPVFKELTRVKEYFAKISVAENPSVQQPNLKLDKQAANRFITSGLAGNDKVELQKAEQQAKERARSYIKTQDSSKKRKVGEIAGGDESHSSSASEPLSNLRSSNSEDNIDQASRDGAERSRKGKPKNSKRKVN
ncbi:hypothetical protein DH86_00001299 [Scytalidium sp. 3C]|nr:hypothetical protein DH86_00001299 [Scytalidium sp. 3C]